MAFWDLIKYGWQPNYWLTIGGIPVCWAEVATGQTPPAGYTIDPALVIDQSSQIGSTVNRDNGSANSLPLTFRLLDSVNGTASGASTWIRKWTKQATLTADLSATAPTLTVDDTTGWSNGDVVYLGGEAILIGTVASGTSFTGCTRATRGTAAAVHRTGQGGQLGTNLPRLRGAEVVLWASPLDPGGYATGTLTGDAVQIWRGRVADVRRVANGFDFECSSLDRVLDTPLVARLTGKVDGTKAMFPVNSSWWLSAHLVGEDNAGATVLDQVLKIAPFGSYTNGVLHYGADLKATIIAAWAAAVSAASVGGYVGDLVWNGNDYGVLLAVNLDNLYNTKLTFTIQGSEPKTVKGYGAGTPEILSFWSTVNPTGGGVFGAGGDTLTLAMDGNPADVPAGKGRLSVTLSTGTHTYIYATATPADGVVYLTQVVPASKGALYVHSQPGWFTGASAEILLTSTGNPADLALRALESSGTAGLRGTYDTLGQGAGYAIPSTAIDESSFIKLLADGSLAKLTATTTTAGGGFFDLYGGTLGLFRRAVVVRPDSTGTPKLTAVRTYVGGSDWTTEITDADLLCLAGEPVANVTKLQAPNVIKVTRSGQEVESEDEAYFHDVPSVEAEGAREAEFAVPADSVDEWRAAAQTAALAMFGVDQTVQAVELRIPPWVNAQIGDCVRLDITHPSLYSWASGSTGISGVGRVTGRTLALKDLAVTLTVLCEGNIQTHSLAPAMKVTAHTSTGANPSSVTIPDKYHAHLVAALAFAGGPVYLAAYDPGTVETTSRYLTVSAVASPSGGSVVLTTSGLAGGSVTDGATYLTLPTSAPVGPSITSYQAGFAHDADGSYWT
jgi:hypothetical protein